jgi:sulfate permease, SulP family
MRLPKLVTVFREGYRWSSFKKDLIAGLIVGILAIPMTLAFGIASGVTPKVAIWSGVVGGFFAALLSGSRFQISGPTGAFIVLVASVVGQFGMGGLVISTLAAGLLLILMGATGLGKAVRFVPYPVIVGFTSAIALLIATSQLHDLLGIPMEVVQGQARSLFSQWSSLFSQLGSISLTTCGVSLLTILILVIWPKITTAVPASLVAVVLTTAVAWFFELPVATIATRFGEMSLGAPPALGLFDFDWSLLPQLIQPIIAIALLAGIESLLSAVVADGMTGMRHRSNAELIAQGAGNLASALIGGMPITGGVARTVTNIKAGGRTPIAGICHCIVILILVSCFGQLVSAIPIATLSGVVIVIAYNMSEWRHFKRLFLSPPGDIAVLLTTFILTAFVDLVTGIEAGMILAAFLVVNRLSKTSKVEMIDESRDEMEHYRLVHSLPGVELFELSGSLFFAAVESFEMALRRIQYHPKIIILEMSRVIDIDASGLRVIQNLFNLVEEWKGHVIACGIDSKLQEVMERAQLLNKVDLCATFSESIERAQLYAKQKIASAPLADR